MVWILVKRDAIRGKKEGAVPGAPVLPPSGSICPAFQPRRWEADGAGMGGGIELPPTSPLGKKGKAGTRKSCWEMGLHPQNRRGKDRVLFSSRIQGAVKHSRCSTGGAVGSGSFSSEPQGTQQGETGLQGSGQEGTNPGRGGD